MSKVLYLYSELSPYLKPMFETLVDDYNVDLHVVFWDKNKLTPYEHDENAKIKYYKRSELNSEKIDRLIKTIEPDLIFAVGWMDKGYMRPLFNARRKGIDVVCGFDEVWNNTLRQKVGSLVFRIFGNLFFNFAMVSFTRQFEFARKLGFKTNNIIMNSLSADVDLFELPEEALSSKRANYPKSFIFAGRFSPEKGIQDLLEAYKIYKNELGGVWGLTLVGDGPVEVELDVDGVKCLGFQEPKQLKNSFKNAGALVMPSRFDKSPLVVHEACCSGLPLILSDNIGNKSTFLIDGLNGFSFESENVQALASCLKRIEALTIAKLDEFSKISYSLSKRVSPKISAGSLLSITIQNPKKN